MHSTPSHLGTDPAALMELVDALSVRTIDTRVETPFAGPGHVLEALTQLEFYRLGGAARREGQAPTTIPASVLAGLATGEAPLGFVAAGDGQEVVLAVGSTRSRAASLAATVHAAMGGPPPYSLSLGHAQIDLPVFGCLTGVPSTAVPPDSALDLFLDGLRGVPFLYLVYATPEPVSAVRRDFDRMREAVKEVDRTHLLLPQQSNVDRGALRARELLDAWLRRLESGLSGGLWRVSALLGADSRDHVRHGLELLSGQLRNDQEHALAPVRGYLCGHDRNGADVHANLLSPAELAALCPLPHRDRVGFALRQETRFDVDHRSPEGARIGQIVDAEVPTGRWYAVDDAALCRHTLVAGHTGSGKSTTVKGLLLDLAGRGLPFLVLEPAKAEYRALATSMPGLCVFPVGAPPRAGQMPFLLNPFAFPVGFPLHTHIDFFTQAFVASFGLPPPTPYLLQGAIYRTYEARGWDLVTGRHPNGHDQMSFPTLSDLLEQIDPVMDEADYHGEISANLRAALRTRIGNLCLGPKGLALNTRQGLPDEMLFGGPVVLELRHLGSDEEKALLMGLVITRLYELRETSRPETSDRLRHLLVVEEAHRLLKRTAERSSEESNMAHQAIQTFANLLAELRAYGQGVVLVEQLPSKLEPDMVKHAGTKVIHRLTPRDDRDVVGDAMVLTEAQKRALAALPTGEAVVYGEGMDGAVRVRVPKRDERGPTTADLAARPWRRIEEAQADRLRAVLERSQLAGLLALKEIRDAAERSWFAAFAGLSVEEHVAYLKAETDRLLDPETKARDTAVAFALEDALLRRALFHGWSEAAFEAVRSTLRSNGPAGAARCPQALASHRRVCSRRCSFCYEGAQLAADTLFREDVTAVAEMDSDLWQDALLQAVADCARRRLGWEKSLPDVIIACGIGQVMTRAGVSRRAVDKVLNHVLVERDDAPSPGTPLAVSPVTRGARTE
ncbi:MAG: ATP-binding protein, partial [Deltaproteobacteria bacterium]|nr:ATP-binding protein [Deltaproteobacteria bacterium]